MELPVTVVAAGEIRELIARTILADELESDREAVSGIAPSLQRLGSIELRPHQTSAVRRLNVALNEFGGALLADEVGMGKTFVGLAVAERFHRPLVAAPAVLRDMWSHQANLAGTEIPFVSFESLSRGRHVEGLFDLVLIDEAHHLRNPATRRYRELSRLAMRSQVLMLSATPVHNKRRDLVALLAIFMGSQAESLSARDISRCVVRRGVDSAGLVDRIPRTSQVVWKELRDDADVPTRLLSLPPPLPVRDGGAGGVLVARALIRQWCSSEASLESALRRRLARSIALISALESGHYPSQEELSAWTVADDSVQLAFPSLVATPHSDSKDLLSTIERHRKALHEILQSLDPQHRRDKERADFLREIRRRHPGIPVVAFSQYTETVDALFRELRNEPRVAVLTARGARVAGGSLSRREALARFAPRASGVLPPRAIERIDILLATDLLSEGVNLQDAGVVVHLDLPWTAARLEQRIGRVARMGSAHPRVHTYGIRPPVAAEILIRLEATIAAKVVEAEITAAPTAVDDQIRSIAKMWGGLRALPSRVQAPVSSEWVRVAAIESRRDGFLAICAHSAEAVIVVSDGRRIANEPSQVLDFLTHATERDVPPRASMIGAALDMLNQYLRSENVVAVADSHSAVAANARRAALRRVSAIVQRARPHARSRVMDLAINARSTILGRLGVAAESELMRRATIDLGDEEWLRLFGNSRAGAGGAETTHDLLGEKSPSRVIAILLFDASRFAEL